MTSSNVFRVICLFASLIRKVTVHLLYDISDILSALIKCILHATHVNVLASKHNTYAIVCQKLDNLCALPRYHA